MEKELPPVFVPIRYSLKRKYFFFNHNRIQITKTAQSRLALLCLLLLTGGVIWGQTTYAWNQTGTASWATDVNWTPTRTAPATNDILVFNNGATTTVTSVPTQTIGQLQVSGNTTVNLQGAAAATVLTIGGGTGTDLSVALGSALNINIATNTTKILVATGATGSITGNMTYTSAAHTLDASDANGITFNSPSVFTQGIGCTGNVFTTAGTANAIVFGSGTTFLQLAGANPFGLGQPSSKVVFQTGSLYKYQQNSAPAFSGRTYADLEFNFATFSQSPTGGAVLSIDNLTLTLGTLNLNLTGGINIKGNISVASGQTLTFTPASAHSININGTTVQTIGSAGTLTFSSNANVVLKSATNTILSQNGSGTFSIAGIISSLSGTTPLNIAGTGSGNVNITGTSNTFSGTISITGAEARFSGAGSFGNVNNTIIIDGGKLATSGSASYSIANTHSIQVSNVTGSAISTTTSDVLTYDGVITDKPSTSGVLVKQGAGTLSLGGVSTYTGSTTINNGTLKLTTGSDRLPTTTALNLGQTSSTNLGILDLNGFNQTVAGINSITGSNATANNNSITSSGAATLTINNSGSNAYGDGTNANSGIITGAVSIVKNGVGTQSLGDANTYTGTTAVTQGTLLINGTHSGTGAVTVASGATLGGSGTLPGTVSLSGIISPGNSPGTLNTGAFTFNANSTYKFEISNATGTAGVDWDKIVSSGDINVSASPITIDLTSLSIVNFSNTLPYTWIIAHGTSITGFNAANFTINMANFLPPVGGGFFSITQTGTDINIVFTPTGAPVLTTPTATSITTMDVVLGATIVVDGGSAITERGTVYKTSAGVTSSDNALAEGGTSLGAYSHTRSSLNPETQYFFAGYAITAFGTGLSIESNFRTLSNPPTSEATTFTATPFSASQIDLSWTVASFPGMGASANGYIILRRVDATDPTTSGIINATAPGTLTFPSGTILLTTITSGSTNSYSNTGLNFSSQYNYLIVPFTWDGANAATYNYYLSNAPTVNATTLAGIPLVTTPTVTNISSTSADLGANVTSDGNSALTERGTVYNTSTGVTIADNPLAEGGTSTGVFSHTRSGLNPETQYFFKGYATNANGPALSGESNFYTYSAAPTSEATGFSGVGVSSSAINLSWTAATFPGMGATATGYVILRRSDLTDPTTTGFINGNNPASLSFPVGTTLVATITSGSTITYNNTGLGTPNGQYNYLIVPFTWDNVHNVTYNYYLTNAATTFANTLPGAPLLNNPTATGITQNSATLGANITSNNGGTLSERGTVYKTTTGVTASDNPLAEGGTAIGVFTHSRNSLLPETQYFYAGYAINAGGTGLSSEGSFRTLSNPPLSEVTNFTATSFSNSQINLNWTAATFPMSGATATGYIILRKTGSDPLTTGVINATAPASLSFPPGTILVTTITSGATITYSNTGLAGNTQYNYLIIPFTWNGTNAPTYHYYLPNAPTANSTTASSPPIIWTATGTGSAWYTNSNWTPITSSGAWTSGDIAQFQNFGTASFAGINMNTSSLSIGAVEVTAARVTNNLSIGNSSTTVNGTLTLNGASINGNGGTILRNVSSKNLFLIAQGGLAAGDMVVALGNPTNNRIYIDGAGTISISSIITGTSKLLSLNGVGAGILTLSGNNTYSGGFTLNAGTVIATHDVAYGTGVLTLNGGVVSGSGMHTFANNIAIGGNFTFDGTGSSTYAGTVNLGAASRTITNSTTGGSIILNGIISGSSGSGITFNGSGTGLIYIDGNNTFAGNLNVNGAEVGFASNAALGDAGNTIILDGGRITSATTAGGPVTSVWLSTHGIQVGANTGSSIHVLDALGDLTIDGIISDKPSNTGILVKQGAGILRLSGVSTYTGSTTINLGTLQLTTGNHRLPISTTLQLGQAASANLGSFDLNGFNQEVAGLNSISGTNATASNNSITSSTAVVLTLSGTGAYNYGNSTDANSGVISGSISLVINGTGTQTLGDANDYTGTTDVNQGALIINGIHSGTGAVTVASGGTLGGSGTISGPISLAGIISPGNSPGTLNTNAITFASNSTYKFEVSNATGVPGMDWDKINASGVIDVTATPITIDLTSVSIQNFVNTNNYSWQIATGSSIAGFNSDNFVVNTSNFAPALGVGTFFVSQTGNDLNLVFAAFPVPVLALPTATSITTVDAQLGATIISNGGSSIIERGTVYKTLPGVTASDNPLAEGGLSLGVYSHLRNGLSPETHYYYAGYASNASGTGLSTEANFYTLSNSPTAEVTNFSATPVSAEQINLAWTVAAFPMTGASATGYIILRKTSVNPTTDGIVDATAPGSLTLPGGTTLAATITSGSTSNYSNTGLTVVTQYNYLIVPFAWDGANPATYNYYPTNAPATNATTLNYFQTFASDGSAFNTAKWSSASSAACDVNNQTNAFTSGNIMYFCTPNGTGVGAASTIGGIIATENFSLTSGTGSINNLSNGVVNIDVSNGKLIDFLNQSFGIGTTAGYIKNGTGTLAFAGAAYTGGFTLNAGTVVARNANAFGLNLASGILTLNGGSVAANLNTSFINKYASIVIGGNVQYGSTISPSLGSANMTFNTATSLGNANRTLTLGGSGVITLSGLFSNSGSGGLTFTANANGTGRFDFLNTGNTFTGPVSINGDGGTGIAEVRFTNDGSFGNTSNTININGGRLATPTAGATFTITSSRGIQVGNLPGTSISTTTTGTLTYNGVISDLAGSTPGSWAKQGAAILSLGGASTYTGSTTINNGTLILTTGNNRLPVSTTLSLGQSAVANLGTLNLNGFNQEVAGIISLTGINGGAGNNTINSTDPATLSISGSGTYSYGDGTNTNSGIITGAISLVKSGSGTQTLGDANTYTGATTVSGGELRFIPSVNTSMAGALIMNGGIFGTTGIADMRTMTFSSFDLSDNSKIDLSTLSDHTITFTVAGTFTAGKVLNIYGWQGTAGMSGSKGKIFFGNSAAGLSVAQLAQIIFIEGTIDAPGTSHASIILSTGEVVPEAAFNNTPTIVMNVLSTSDYIDGGVLSSPATPYALSGVIGDPTDPFSTLGIDFTVDDVETGAGSLVVTGSSSNISVVPNGNIIITGMGATRNARITPTGVGYSNISIMVSDGVHTATYVISYAASDASVNASTTRFFTGTSDASTAQVIDANYMFVGDDQNQVLRLYNRQNSGLPVSGSDFSTSLSITPTNPQTDIEGSVKVGSRIYWLGSHSNADSDGALRTNRYRLFATDIAGIGMSSTLSYVGRYDGLRTDLIAWDASDGHGLGAGYFGLSASAAAGVIPEAADGSGFNIEGMTMAPDNTTAYICFRAPISPASNRTDALIVPVTNLTSLVAGNPSTGPATFGAPILLDLDGLGIREIMRNGSGQYLIIAGPHDGGGDIRLYTWTGNAVDVPEPRAADLTALETGGSIESILNVPDPLLSSSVIPLLVDNGSTIYYGDGFASNELPNTNHQKFRSEQITLGCSTKVFNTNDAGGGSLRDVIACVPEGSTVTFVNSLVGSTIALMTGEILIDKNITISGPGLVTDLLLSGNNATRIFHVAAGKTLTLKNMSLVNATATAPNGGAIYVEGNLNLQNMVLENNFENGIIRKGITINSPGGLIQIIGNNVQIKD